MAWLGICSLKPSVNEGRSAFRRGRLSRGFSSPHERTAIFRSTSLLAALFLLHGRQRRERTCSCVRHRAVLLCIIPPATQQSLPIIRCRAPHRTDPSVCLAVSCPPQHPPRRDRPPSRPRGQPPRTSTPLQPPVARLVRPAHHRAQHSKHVKQEERGYRDAARRRARR